MIRKWTGMIFQTRFLRKRHVKPLNHWIFFPPAEQNEAYLGKPLEKDHTAYEAISSEIDTEVIL